MARFEDSWEQINPRLTSSKGGLNRPEDKLESRFSHLDRKPDTRSNVLAWPSGGFGFVIVAWQILKKLDILITSSERERRARCHAD